MKPTSKIKQFIKKAILHQPGSDSSKSMIEQFGKLSFSQSGEDLIIDYIFQLRGITQPSYIDIGANHPYYLSNTALFYAKGCRGINVEPDPDLIKSFNEFRSEDINLNIGVGTINEQELDFFSFNDPTLNTFSQAEAERYLKTGKYHIVQTKKIKTYTLEYLFRNYSGNSTPDFISIDVEGLDFAIVKTINFHVYRPKVICVEAYDYSSTGAGRRREELISYIISKNYYEYADTGLNSILVEKDFWFV